MLPQVPEPDRHPVRPAGAQSALAGRDPAGGETGSRVAIGHRPRRGWSRDRFAGPVDRAGRGARGRRLVPAPGGGGPAIPVWRAAPSAGHLDPYAVPEPWRQYVRQAVGAQQRFDSSVAGWPAGPLRDRLVRSSPGYGRVSTRCGWWPSGRGPGGGRGRQGQPSVDQLSAQLRQVQAEQQRTPASDRQQALARTEEAIAAQLRAARRTDDVKAELLDRFGCSRPAWTRP